MRDVPMVSTRKRVSGARRGRPLPPAARRQLRALLDDWVDEHEQTQDAALRTTSVEGTAFETLVATARGIDGLLGLERRANPKRALTQRPRQYVRRDRRKVSECIARLRQVVTHFEAGIRDKRQGREMVKRLNALEADLTRLNAGPTEPAPIRPRLRLVPACRKVMTQYGLTATEAATFIVKRIVPSLGDDPRRALVGEYPDTARQIAYLVDRLKPRRANSSRR